MQEFIPEPFYDGKDKEQRPSFIRKLFEADTLLAMSEKLRASEELEKQRGMKLEREFQWNKVGRNDACPCGSGKKFKFCHLPIL